MVDVAFVSTNAGKFREAREILRPYGVRLRWIRRALPEPQAEDLAEVARAKARSAPPARGYVLVEDSGLFVRALHDFPGVYSAHFLRIWGFAPILELLARRPRAASFRSVAAVRRGARVWTFSGRVDGSIARRPAGRGGFGYDPIFVPRGRRTTFAQMRPAEKNALSHRARSMEKVGAFLRGREPGRPRSG